MHTETGDRAVLEALMSSVEQARSVTQTQSVANPALIPGYVREVLGAALDVAQQYAATGFPSFNQARAELDYLVELVQQGDAGALRRVADGDESEGLFDQIFQIYKAAVTFRNGAIAEHQRFLADAFAEGAKRNNLTVDDVETRGDDGSATRIVTVTFDKPTPRSWWRRLISRRPNNH